MTTGRLLIYVILMGITPVLGQKQTTNVQGDLSKWFASIENEDTDSSLFVYGIPFFHIEEHKSNANQVIDTFDAMTPQMYSYLKHGFSIKPDSLIFGLNSQTERYVFFKQNMSSENIELLTNLLKNRSEYKYYDGIACLNYELLLGQDTIDQIRALFNENTSSIALDVMELQFQKGARDTWHFWELVTPLKKYHAYTLSENFYGIFEGEKNIIYLHDDKKKRKEQIKLLLKYQKKALKRKHLKKGGKYVLSDGTEVEIIK